MTLKYTKIALLLAFAALGLAACGGYEGRYVYAEGGVEALSVELKGDDVAVVTIAGIQSVQGTWTADGDTVNVTVEGDTNSFTKHEDGLMTQGFGGQTVLVKQ
jgi:hypothetical protein